jgi:hypothetical protein
MSACYWYWEIFRHTASVADKVALTGLLRKRGINMEYAWRFHDPKPFDPRREIYGRERCAAIG